MSLKVLFFGHLTDIVKKGEIHTDNFSNTGDLVNFLEKEFPKLKQAKYSISVNRNLINKITNLNEYDEIALLPPFSGG